MKDISIGLKIFLIIVIILLSINIIPAIHYAHGGHVILNHMNYGSITALEYLGQSNVMDWSVSIYTAVAIPYYIAIAILLFLIIINKKQKNVMICFSIIICIIITMLFAMKIKNKKMDEGTVESIRSNNNFIYDYIRIDDYDLEDEIYLIKYKNNNTLLNAVKIVSYNEYLIYNVKIVTETEDEYIIQINYKNYKVEKDIIQEEE